MKFTHTMLFGFAISLLLLMPVLSIYDEEPSYAKRGQLDLQHTLFASERLVPLDGMWEFYGGRLFAPEDFSNGIAEDPDLINVPGTWKDKHERLGYGTYRLVLDNVPINQGLGIKKQNIRSASSIFINGKLVSEEGVVETQQIHYQEGNIPKLIFFQSGQQQLEIIIQVSDFSFNSAGIATSIYFGEQDALVSGSFRNVLFELAIIAVLLTIGMLYIFLYLFVERYRRKEFFILAFAMSCIFFALINLCLSERTILYILPNLSFEAMFKIKDTSIFLATISLILIISQFNKQLLAPWLTNLLLFLYAFYVIVILLTSLNFYHSFLPIFVLLNCFTYIYSMIRLLYISLKKKMVDNDYQQKIVLFILLNINIYNINLLLYSFGLTSNLQIGFLNILLYAIALAIFLTIRVNQSYKRNDYLTQELDVTEQAYLVAQIKPHFFFNTLTSVMALCYTDSKKAAQLLSHFSSFLRQSFEFNSRNVFVTVDQEIKLLHSYIAIEKARFGEKLQIKMDIDPDAWNESIIPLSIQPLVENAIIHGINPKEEGGIIELSVQKMPSSLVVTVFDTGDGIPADKISDLLDATDRTECGIGLVNVNKRLVKYYSTHLLIQSKQGAWTKVTFEIPLP